MTQKRILVHPAGNYMIQVKNRSTETLCEICSKLTKHQNDANGF